MANTLDAENLPSYRGGRNRGSEAKLLLNLLFRLGLERWEPFTCLNSLREVEPTVKLIIDDGGLDDLTQEVPTAPEATVVNGEDDE